MVRFYDPSKNPNLIKKIHLNIDILDYEKAKGAYEAIQRSKNLLEFTISRQSDNCIWNFPPGWFVSIMIKSCPKLRKLKLDLKEKILSKDSFRNVVCNLGIDKNKAFDEIKLIDEESYEKGRQMLNGMEFHSNIDENGVIEITNEIYLRAISIHLKNLEYFDICLSGDIETDTFNLFFNERASSLKSLKIDISFQRNFYYSLQLSRQELTFSMYFTYQRAFFKIFPNVKFQNLECLELNFFRGSIRGFITAIPEYFPNLTNLVITECDNGNEDVCGCKQWGCYSVVRV